MILKPLTDRRWRGYSLDELQEQIVVNDVRIMMQKKALLEKVDGLKFKASNAKASTAFTTAYKYIDYIVLGITLLRKLIPFFSRFRKKKDG